LQKDCYISEVQLYHDFEICPLKQDIGSFEKEFGTSIILKGLTDKQINLLRKITDVGFNSNGVKKYFER
jgi:hypothetical protein